MGLTTDEAKRLARESLHETVKLVNLPSFVRLHFEDGEPCLIIDVSMETGDAVIHYKPRAATECIALAGMELGDPRADLLPKEVVAELQRGNIESLVADLLATCIHEFVETVDNIPELTYALTRCLRTESFHQLASLRGEKHPDPFTSRNVIDQVLELANKGRRERLEEVVKETQSLYRPQFQHLFPVYRYLKPIWDDAKSCYKRNRKSPKWPELVKTECNDSELKLPLDLIYKLDDKRSGSDSYKSEASALAVEHAARLCGVKSNALQTRTLMERRKKSEEEFFETHGVKEPDPSYCERLARKLIREKALRERNLSGRTKMARNTADGRTHLTAVK